MKGDGGFNVRNGIIYVFGTINKKRHRFSTNKSDKREFTLDSKALLECSFTKTRKKTRESRN